MTVPSNFLNLFSVQNWCRDWCEGEGKVYEMLLPIFKQVVHFKSTSDGPIFIFLNSHVRDSSASLA